VGAQCEWAAWGWDGEGSFGSGADREWDGLGGSVVWREPQCWVEGGREFVGLGVESFRAGRGWECGGDGFGADGGGGGLEVEGGERGRKSRVGGEGGRESVGVGGERVWSVGDWDERGERVPDGAGWGWGGEDVGWGEWRGCVQFGVEGGREPVGFWEWGDDGVGSGGEWRVLEGAVGGWGSVAFQGDCGGGQPCDGGRDGWKFVELGSGELRAAWAREQGVERGGWAGWGDDELGWGWGWEREFVCGE
jgi:hypothetical protein